MLSPEIEHSVLSPAHSMGVVSRYWFNKKIIWLYHTLCNRSQTAGCFTSAFVAFLLRGDTFRRDFRQSQWVVFRILSVAL